METKMEVDAPISEPEITNDEIMDLDKAIVKMKFPDDCRKKMVDDRKELWISAWHGENITLDSTFDDSSFFLFMSLLLVIKNKKVLVLSPSVINAYKIMSSIRGLARNMDIENIDDKLRVGVPLDYVPMERKDAVVIYALPPSYESYYKEMCQVIYQPMDGKRPDGLIMSTCSCQED